MKIRNLSDQTSFRSDCYIVEGAASDVVIDPSCDVREAEKQISDFSRIKGILITHGHFDHVLHLTEWVEKTNAAVFIGEKDADKLDDPAANASLSCQGEGAVFPVRVTTVKEGDVLSFGDLSFGVKEVPGHTSGSVAYLLKSDDGTEHMFSGDLLFAGGGYGRTDLPTGSARDLLRSVKAVLSFPESTVLHPGHGGFSFTVGDLRSHFHHLSL